MAYVKLRRRVTPYRVNTPAAVRHWWDTSTEAAALLVLAAEVDGRIVGTGQVSLNTWTSERGAASAFVMVDPAQTGRGIGGALYDALLAHLSAHGAHQVQGWAVDDPKTAGWCQRRGLTHTRDMRYAQLDLTDLHALPEPPALPAGANIASWSEIGPVGVHQVDAAATIDEPNDVPVDAMPYDEWLAEIWQGPETDLDASTVVLVDGAPAAYSLVEADHDTHRMWSGGTGTLLEHRGRGLARIAKSVALRRAAAAGITAAYTSNDKANAPMLAVNAWLGYRACGTELSYSRRI